MTRSVRIMRGLQSTNFAPLLVMIVARCIAAMRVVGKRIGGLTTTGAEGLIATRLGPNVTHASVRLNNARAANSRSL